MVLCSGSTPGQGTKLKTIKKIKIWKESNLET